MLLPALCYAHERADAVGDQSLTGQWHDLCPRGDEIADTTTYESHASIDKPRILNINHGPLARWDLAITVFVAEVAAAAAAAAGGEAGVAVIESTPAVAKACREAVCRQLYSRTMSVPDLEDAKTAKVPKEEVTVAT